MQLLGVITCIKKEDCAADCTILSYMLLSPVLGFRSRSEERIRCCQGR